MSRISPPIRIVLVGAVLFLAAWFTVLKPKEEVLPPEPAATTAPGAPQSTAGDFRAKAKTGAATAEVDAAGAANATLEDGAPGSAAAAPATSAPSPRASASGSTTDTATGSVTAPALPPLTAEALKGLPSGVRSALKGRKTVVLGVLDTASSTWSPMADDDRAMRSVLRRVNRYRGEVVVSTVPIARLAKYDGLIKALGVTQSPTVVIIDRDRQGRTLTGYADRVSVNQAIADARRTRPVANVKTSFKHRTNALCGRYSMRMDRLGVRGTGSLRAQWQRDLADISSSYTRAFARVPASGRQRVLRSRIVAGVRSDVASTRRAGHAPNRGVLADLSTTLEPVGLTSCVAIRAR